MARGATQEEAPKAAHGDGKVGAEVVEELGWGLRDLGEELNDFMLVQLQCGAEGREARTGCVSLVAVQEEISRLQGIGAGAGLAPSHWSNLRLLAAASEVLSALGL